MLKTVKRNEKIAFLKVSDGSGDEYVRMRGFTEFSMSKNPIEYTRKYIDEKNERSDVIGYSPSIRYSFDMINNDHVQEKFYKITALEKVGEEAAVEIVIVDLLSDSDEKVAFYRTWTVVPDTEGDDESTYTFSGTLKANSEVIIGVADSDDNWETCRFAGVFDEDV